ncbi:MAG: GlsB/YeaQ/YmgE family stress response membrane protein [Hydrogenophaga sp.]|uniref:GlsB/YeaQ/YmgE family stress response membrane protein n=1 Tax=Hydrogenophaga sp. TaxID=1904254 RepID=UPI0016A4180A|nr:GlsB/YeaQ/YmgE family stress response membrane protein [Hydrogenophaga sp.]NIM41158.1 GlsB/YeaQ/YmgE family stress response membrane protein [Hydrogenophaga sp.]NIN26474.1 GlsB/YeaQ/YmgE family stress response membrane protein [Hydrogenophaga sp.]NIN31349.1 GlsB/YeaQ/YmgE family stress response membrane protein [Hydrogenophaga sp.]NIN55404.1 GlsB/YeaQ/YmgE family stress response membrane protein [Hydrogenophaga sp.]NIO51739.1 GlsB/YeaQ/YmgE family stress response membrane protein [Hydrogeno
MMSILGTILIGLIAGFVARMLKPGDDSMGWIMTAVLGIAGAFVATYLGAALGFYAPGQAAGFIASVIGAIVLLVIWGMFKGKK